MNADGYTLTVLSDVRRTPHVKTGWLWPGYIPSGAMGIFDGDPGLGKSFVTMDLAARVSKGMSWPDGTAGGKAAGVLLMCAEDSKATIVDRLVAAGADLDKVVMLDEVGGQAAELPRDLPIVEKIIKERKVKLLVIDPVMAFLGVTAYRDQSVRSAIAPLARMAEATGATVILIRHLTKTSRNAKQAGGGSMGLIGQARFAYLFSESPDAPQMRIMGCSKMNLAKEPASLEYHLAAATDGTIVKWSEEPVKWLANDLLVMRAANTEERAERQEAIDFLKDYLEENGNVIQPVPLFEDAKIAGFSKDQIKRAKKRLGVKSVKLGVFWFWVPPDYDPLRRLRRVK